MKVLCFDSKCFRSMRHYSNNTYPVELTNNELSSRSQVII